MATVAEKEREIDLMYERDPKAAAAAMRELCAVVDDTGREIGLILNRGKEGDDAQAQS